jgi:hypothetical protein
MKRFLGLLFLFMVTHVFAGGTDTVRILNVNTMVVTGVTNKSFTLGSDTPNGDATSETAPAKIYVPIARQVTTPVVLDNQEYFSLAATEGVTTLFGITSPLQYISFPLVITTGSNTNYLYAAVKSGTNYYVVAKYQATSSNVTSQVVYFNISPNEICTQIISAGGRECDLLTLASASEVNPAPKIPLYFFQSTSLLAVPGGAAVPASTDSGGVYFEVQMSNRVYESSELLITLDPITVGDGRLNLNFSTSAQMTDFNKVLVYQQNSISSPGPNLPVGRYTGGSFIDLNSLSPSGKIIVNKLSDGSPLVNDTDYFFSLVLVDKFKFASTLPYMESGKPLLIEQLLKKQACYLLTAGFGEEHYVITYFRNFRDNVLLKNWLGTKFVNFYYETAPKYALIIYKSDVLRSVIRGMAYSLYFIFRNVELLSILMSLLITFLVFKRVKKWQQLKKT